MIQRLFDKARPYRSQGYTEASKRILDAEDALKVLLDQEDRQLLERLTNAYGDREGTVGLEAFTNGFCAAVLLAVDILQRPPDSIL